MSQLRLPLGHRRYVDDEAVAPFGGVGVCGTGARLGGGAANVEAFTETQWLTMQSEIAAYPF